MGKALGQVIVMSVMERIADLTILFYTDLSKFIDELVKFKELGMLEKVEVKGDVIYIKGKLNTGLVRAIEPLNTFVALSMAFFGMYFTQMDGYVEAHKKVVKWWRERVKAEVEAKKSAKN